SVAMACAAKGIALDAPAAGEEWLSSPYATLRFLRQTVRSLVMLERNGNTPLGPTGTSEDGRLTVRVFPASRLDRLLFMGVRGDVHLEEGVGERELHERRARFHKQPDHDGRVCLVLGAGNVNSIPAADVVTKLFNEGKVCVLKMNPVNAYMGPLLEEAFADAVSAGFLAVVYGGAEEGAYLASHPAVQEVHITGSDRTHDLIVWGPPGPERAERMARQQPLLAKEITSELGNVTPVLVVPGPWSDRELAYQADSVAGMVTHNASFNCIAGKVLITPRGWRKRDRFLELVLQRMALTPARRAWYPGAEARYHALTEGRTEIRRLGGGEGTLPWTLLTGLDAARADEAAFTTEPFCSILSETEVGSDDPGEFLEAATRFANERLWGTLSAAIVASSRTLRDRAGGAAVERAVHRLRYGSVCVNLWPGMAYASGTGPWGAYPGSPLTNIQSGRGWVHNTLMLDGMEKFVMRGPAWSPVKLPYFPSHRSAHVMGRALTELEERGSWAKVPAVLAGAVRQ
ncbi:MAG TPA: aldehyde dehydrogenase family protein, partial [Anaeromyxobacteraceae bacterium]|nr:aldehyde dehydrogenase family protein [Anaeromyxobacteraceae bacterium]